MNEDFHVQLLIAGEVATNTFGTWSSPNETHWVWAVFKSRSYLCQFPKTPFI